MARIFILLLVLSLTFSIAESRIRYRPPYRPTIHQWFWGRCADWQNAVRNNGFRVIKRGVLQNIEFMRPKDCPFPRRK